MSNEALAQQGAKRTASNKSVHLSTAQTYRMWANSREGFQEARDFYAQLGCNSEGAVIIMEPFDTLFDRETFRAKSDSFFSQRDDTTGEWALNSPAPADLVLAPLGALEHVGSHAERRSLLGRIRDLLAEGGRLIFDMGRPQPETDGQGVPRLVMEAAGEGVKIMLWEVWRAEPTSTRTELRLAVEKLAGGGVVESKRYHSLLTCRAEPEALDREVRSAGFEVEGVYGGFGAQPLAPESPRQVWVVKRPLSAKSSATSAETVN